MNKDEDRARQEQGYGTPFLAPPKAATDNTKLREKLAKLFLGPDGEWADSHHPIMDQAMQLIDQEKAAELHDFIANGKTIYESSVYQIDGPTLAKRIAQLKQEEAQ